MAGKRVKAGQLRYLITIEQNVDSRDAYGGVVNGWIEYTQLWAAASAAGGGESLSSEQISANRRYNFICRAVPGNAVTSQMRITWDSRVFDIQSVIDFEERGRFLKIEAVERGL